MPVPVTTVYEMTHAIKIGADWYAPKKKTKHTSIAKEKGTGAMAHGTIHRWSEQESEWNGSERELGDTDLNESYGFKYEIELQVV